MRILISFIIVGVFLRSYKLGRALGGGDENEVLLSWVYTPIDSIVTTWSHGAMGGHHVFHTIVLRMMVLLFGEENELAIRFPAFAAGVICLWFIYKIAREIFPSKTVAQFALLAIVVSPVHIYYSQTARGYSFVMLFSTLAIYATLKLLQSPKYYRWSLLLFLSGFLLVYTHPLSVLFILGIAFWILFVLKTSALKSEFGLNQDLSSKKIYQFFSIFLLIGICSVLAYWPMMERMILSSTGYFNAAKVYPSTVDMLINFIPNLFFKIFPGPLIYFSPFIIVGIFFDKACSYAYRALPVIILLITYIFTLISGLAWYPRAYLFNLPLMLIFLGSGVVRVGDSLRDFIKSKPLKSWSSGSIITTYFVLCLAELFLNHYPSINTYDAKEYSQKIRDQIKNNDLLLVADSRHYLYARSIYKKNLKNIIADNHIGGIKLLVNSKLNIEDYIVKTLNVEAPVFLNWQGELNYKSLAENRRLIHLNEIESIPLLTKDFEATTEWIVNSGSGSFALLDDHRFTENYSLLTKASPGNNMVLKSLVSQIELTEPKLIVLVWSTKKVARGDKYFMPALGISSMINGKKNYGQVMLGKTNPGMSLYIKEQSSGEKPYYWQVHSAIGWLPAGNFSLNLFLYCEAGKSLLYDSLRLFLVNNAPQKN